MADGRTIGEYRAQLAAEEKARDEAEADFEAVRRNALAELDALKEEAEAEMLSHKMHIQVEHQTETLGPNQDFFY